MLIKDFYNYCPSAATIVYGVASTLITSIGERAVVKDPSGQLTQLVAGVAGGLFAFIFSNYGWEGAQGSDYKR